MKLTNVLGGALVLLLASAAPSAWATNWSQLQCGDNWGPKTSVAPVYPRRAMERGKEGSIVMGFSISPEGTVEDITVVEGDKAFIRTATRAVEQLEFPPCVIDGMATRQANVSIKYDFNLD